MPLAHSDERFMSACIRYSRHHQSLTGKNPSVATLIVKDNKIISRGITAIGGHPHSETQALESLPLGYDTTGTCAYISLEPCSHYGVTPPCVDALIASGISRVVTALTDPDERVSGAGHKKLIDSSIDLSTDCCSDFAHRELHLWLSYKRHNRPHITLKLAVSSEGYLGKRGERTMITSDLSLRTAQRLRAQYDAILVGSITHKIDSPRLTCRLSGLESRSPRPFVLTSKTSIPDLLRQMFSDNITSLLVEGGAKTASSFLDLGLVDRIVLFTSSESLGISPSDAILSPLTLSTIPSTFISHPPLNFGTDRLDIFDKRD